MLDDDQPLPATSIYSESLEAALRFGGYPVYALTAAPVRLIRGATDQLVMLDGSAPDESRLAPLRTALDALLKDKKALAAVLTYHVVAGKVLAADVVKLKEAKTVNGAAAKIMVNGGKVMVDGANVVKTDIIASNGVIHVIDAVIMPPKGK